MKRLLRAGLALLVFGASSALAQQVPADPADAPATAWFGLSFVTETAFDPQFGRLPNATKKQQESLAR